MRGCLRVLVGTCLGLAMLATAAVAGNTPRGANPQLAAKLDGELPGILEAAEAKELVSVTIVMRDQVPRAQIEQAKTLRNRTARRQLVTGLLKSVADASQRDLLAFLRAKQQAGSVGPHIRSLWIHNVIGVQLTRDVAYAIAARDDVAYLNDDATIGREVFPVQPSDDDSWRAGGNIECGVDVMQAPRVWDELGITGNGVVVGIVDTGACITHPDLQNQIWVNPGEIPNNGVDDDKNGFIDDINGWNFRDNTNNLEDTNSHGTHTTGTVSGDGTNGTTTGMAPDVSMMILKFWNNFGGEQVVWDAMQYAVDNNADVITASIGWPHNVGPDRPTWRTVCENAIAAGVVVIYAAGNEGGCCPPDNVRTPGDVPLVITIGATDCSDGIAGFSSRGPITWQDIPPWNDWPYPPGKIKPSVSAPGVDTVSTSNNCSSYRTLSGTSMATPHVAGAVALILEANPDLDPEQVKQILMDTSLDLGAEGMDNDFGAGRVNAFAAVELAMSMRTTTRPTDLRIVRGHVESGELADLFSSDDSRLNVQPGPTQNPEEPPVWLELTGTASTDTPSALSFILETNVDTPGVTQTIKLFNYDTQEFEEIDSRTASFNVDDSIEIEVVGDPSRFVNSESLEIKAELTWKPGPIVILFPWTVGIDQAVWAISP